MNWVDLDKIISWKIIEFKADWDGLWKSNLYYEKSWIATKNILESRIEKLSQKLQSKSVDNN